MLYKYQSGFQAESTITALKATIMEKICAKLFRERLECSQPGDRDRDRDRHRCATILLLFVHFTLTFVNFFFLRLLSTLLITRNSHNCNLRTHAHARTLRLREHTIESIQYTIGIVMFCNKCVLSDACIVYNAHINIYIKKEERRCVRKENRWNSTF